MTHQQASILAVAICALISGAKSYTAIGQWATGLSPALLRRLGCRWSERLKCYLPPSEPTLRRTLQSVDAEKVDRAIGNWLASQQQSGEAIAVDGKALHGSKGKDGRPIYLLSAFLQKEKIVIAQQQVAPGSNEVPVFQPLLKPLPLEGKVVTADALHLARVLKIRTPML